MADLEQLNKLSTSTLPDTRISVNFMKLQHLDERRNGKEDHTKQVFGTLSRNRNVNSIEFELIRADYVKENHKRNVIALTQCSF